jgi:nicotinamide N-methyltransferase
MSIVEFELEDDSDPCESLASIFKELPRPPSPEPTIAIYNRDFHSREARTGNQSDENTDKKQWDHIDIRLVGTHPLWGHYLWNAARSFATYLDNNTHLYMDSCVLELGAGGGLPGIVALKNGARKVVLTDYPDACLLENLEFNVAMNTSPAIAALANVLGYIWGRSVEPLLESLAAPQTKTSVGFDLIIMSDLIFNHSQHDALLKTCEETLAHIPSSQSAPVQRVPALLVFYTHHRPHLAHRDLEFFTKASERGWICDEIVEEKFTPMFPTDPGAEEVRSTVHGWRLTRRTLEPVSNRLVVSHS